MSYIQTLTDNQKRNAKLIDDAVKASGLTNKFLRAGILAVASKESGLAPKREIGYGSTPNARIRTVFAATRNLSDAQLNQLKADDRAFFNLVYGTNPYLGNKLPDDGYNFRGGGFNQLTGRANFTNMGHRANIDLENHPELIEDAAVSAAVLARFFYDGLVAGQMTGVFFSRYKIHYTREIATIIQGARIAHNVNMGWKSPPESDPTGGLQITLARAPEFLATLKD